MTLPRPDFIERFPSEAGTHDELVAAGGAYAALWRIQTGMLELDDALPAG